MRAAGSVVAALLGLGSATASAQTAPAPVAPPPPPVVVVVPPMAPAAPDPARVAAANKLLGAMSIERQYDTLLGQMIPIMTAQLTVQLRDNVNMPDALRAQLADETAQKAFQAMLSDEVGKEFRARYGELRRLIAIEYAREFTLADLAALTEFYGSPVGQRALVAMPKLQARLIPIGMRVGMEAGRAAMETTMKRQVGDGAKPPRT